MRFRHVRKLAEIAPAAWDAVFADPYPFTRHAWLHALEDERCVGKDCGWEPWHVVAEDERGQVIGAAPLYIKHHSYGEFVFDFSWAQASHQIGARYYPKLLNAIPYVPSSGPRIGAATPAIRLALAEYLAHLPAKNRMSSLHTLFASSDDVAAFRQQGMLERHDVQFHWRDRGYGDFGGFVAVLSSDKRKKLLRERRRVAEAGITFEARCGKDLLDSEWSRIYKLYAHTYHERGQEPYFTRDFLVRIGRDPALDLRIVCAMADGRIVAIAITLVGGDTLYGRHWGAEAHYHSLHFECCYYQGIDLCLREGLGRFDAGTQGEHKHGRGFEPERTHSFHALAHPRLRDAVEEYLQRERSAVAARAEVFMHHTPYRAPGS